MQLGSSTRLPVPIKRCAANQLPSDRRSPETVAFEEANTGWRLELHDLRLPPEVVDIIPIGQYGVQPNELEIAAVRLTPQFVAHCVMCWCDLSESSPLLPFDSHDFSDTMRVLRPTDCRVLSRGPTTLDFQCGIGLVSDNATYGPDRPSTAL